MKHLPSPNEPTRRADHKQIPDEDDKDEEAKKRYEMSVWHLHSESIRQRINHIRSAELGRRAQRDQQNALSTDILQMGSTATIAKSQDQSYFSTQDWMKEYVPVNVERKFKKEVPEVVESLQSSLLPITSHLTEIKSMKKKISISSFKKNQIWASVSHNWLVNQEETHNKTSVPNRKRYLEIEKETPFSDSDTKIVIPDYLEGRAEEEKHLPAITCELAHTSSQHLDYFSALGSVTPRRRLTPNPSQQVINSTEVGCRESAVIFQSSPFLIGRGYGCRGNHPRNLNNNKKSPLKNVPPREFGCPSMRLSTSTEDNFAPQKRLLAYVRVWTCLCFASVLIGSSVVVATIKHEEASRQQVKDNIAVESPILTRVHPYTARRRMPQGASSASTHASEHTIRQHVPPVGPFGKDEDEDMENEEHHEKRNFFEGLREEFDTWVQKHNRNYRSVEETEKRFKIWMDNHHRTIEKNKQHGPCKLTKQDVFGDNHFKDLTTEEFKERYLTGYKGPHAEEFEEAPILGANNRYVRRNINNEKEIDVEQHESHPHRTMKRMEGTLDPLRTGDPRTALEKHPEIQDRFLKRWDQAPMPLGKTYIKNWNERKEECGNERGKTYVKRDRQSSSSSSQQSTEKKCSNSYYLSNPMYQSSSYSYGVSYSCSWWDVSCWLQVIFSGSMFGGTLEPEYDSNSYPTCE